MVVEYIELVKDLNIKEGSLRILWLIIHFVEFFVGVICLLCIMAKKVPHSFNYEIVLSVWQ